MILYYILLRKTPSKQLTPKRHMHVGTVRHGGGRVGGRQASAGCMGNRRLRPLNSLSRARHRPSRGWMAHRTNLYPPPPHTPSPFRAAKQQFYVETTYREREKKTIRQVGAPFLHAQPVNTRDPAAYIQPTRRRETKRKTNKSPRACTSQATEGDPSSSRRRCRSCRAGLASSSCDI